MVKISIIMPVYNASKYLKTSINSILRQEIDDIEIICVNDGSTDNSLKILEKYSKKYHFIKIINQKNKGPAISRNNAIKEAKGQYIAFLDADDIYLDKTALKQMYDIAIRNDANMVCANLRKIKQNLELEETYDYNNQLYTYFTEEKLLKSSEYGIPWAFYKNIYKRDFIQKNNITFPNLSAGEDPLFLAKALTITDDIIGINTDLYGYNHSIGGGLNIKLNTHQKREDYITHFIKTFDILQKEGFEEVLSDYKKEFIDYLDFRDNINNTDIQEIIREQFKEDTHFDESDYGYLILQILKNENITEDDEYQFMKYCLFEESMLEDTFIEQDRLIDYIKLTKNNTINKQEISYKQLKQIENETFEEKRNINGKVDKLKNNITYYIKSNDKILTSNSWKLTSFLRNLKHKL